jgi:hypothetical protein
VWPHDYFACDYWGGDYWPPTCEVARQAGGKRRRWDRERELANARAALLAAVGRPLGQDEEDELLAVVYWWLQ